MGGKPLVDAEVYFHTEKFTGFGKTDEEGKYTLAQGAAIGPNKVYISKLEGGGAARPAANDPTLALDDPGQTEAAKQAQVGRAPTGPRELIPPQFSSLTTTKLSADVPEAGDKAVDFNL